MNPFVIDSCRQFFEGKKVLLGVTGSIAAYKTPELVRFLKKCGAQVKVVLTDGGKNFVTPLALSTVSEQPVMESMWEDATGTHHISAARWADAVLVAPASANVIAKIANGLCDDLLTTEILAFTGPLFIAPAMNPAMWSAVATQENVSRLKQRGVFFLGPEVGETSCKEEGAGRMMEPEDIVPRVALELAQTSEAQPRVLITLGPTRSYADPVRFLTNRSSGLMGASFAWSAALSGYNVTCIAGPTDAVLPPVHCRVLRAETAKDMYEAATQLWSAHDIFIGTAAVLDWEFSSASAEKIKKDGGTRTVDLAPAPDILATICQRKREDQFALGFAAETNNVMKYAKDKLATKRCDAIFSNDVSKAQIGFESSHNAGWWIDAKGSIEFTPQNKPELAAALLALAVRKWQTKASNYSLEGTRTP